MVKLKGAVKMSKNGKQEPVGAALAVAGRGKEFTPTPRVIKFTPALAERILDNNRLNRPLRQGRVEQYARDMKAGRWAANGETIKLTQDGDLLDGQHRLFAVVESGKEIEMLLVEGLDPAVMPTIDTGAPRTFGDVLGIQGGKNNLVTASVLRWLWWYPKRKSQPSGPTHQRITHQELFDSLPKHPDVPLRVSEITGGGSKQARRFVPVSILAFVYTLAYRADPTVAGAWLHQIDSGMGIDEEKHPVHQLRERMLANRLSSAKLPAIDVCALTIKSYNHLLTGKRTKTLTWKRVEDFPSVERLAK